MKPPKVLLFFFCVVGLFSNAQRVQSSDPKFNFKDGVYLSIEEYKNNQPSLPFNRFCQKDGSTLFDFKLEPTLYYRNDTNGVSPLSSSSLFGYAHYGNFYIKVDYLKQSYFARLVVIGALCHFVCEVQQSTVDYYYNTPRYTTAMLQFALDHETGKVVPFNQESFLVFLQRDKELYDEFTLLPKKKKKDLTFFYLRKYNQKHPVYFPLP